MIINLTAGFYLYSLINLILSIFNVSTRLEDITPAIFMPGLFFFLLFEIVRTDYLERDNSQKTKIGLNIVTYELLQSKILYILNLCILVLTNLTTHYYLLNFGFTNMTWLLLSLCLVNVAICLLNYQIINNLESVKVIKNVDISKR